MLSNACSNSALQHTFEPIAPPLSPNVAGARVPFEVNAASADQSRLLLNASASNAAELQHWFFLVNGQGASENPNVAPNVLTVNGPAAAGAPQPNGGTTVGVAPLSSQNLGNQLWTAVPGSQSGYYYLRSARSFTPNQNSNSTIPSVLTGFDADPVYLDLGVSQGQVGVYMNQAQAPAVGGGQDNSAFQQWSYDTATAQLTNYLQAAQLYQNGNSAAVASQDPGLSNQWYAYPNYLLWHVLQQPAVPFPAPADSGEAAAYYYISSLLGVADANCSLEGISTYGIRCEYSNLASSATSTCASAVQVYQNPGSVLYRGVDTAISAQDWQSVQAQIASECGYAATVQDLFSDYQAMMTAVLVDASDQIAPLATNLAIPPSQGLNPIPVLVLEGILYTVLCATGDPAAGVMANLIATGTNVALAADSGTSSSLNSPLATTAANLYSDLATSFQAVLQGLASAETSILSDWGRLQAVGKAANVTGYNGLGITPEGMATAETVAIQGYAIVAMQQLLGVNYALYSNTAQLASDSNSFNPPSYDSFSYSTYGSLTENVNSQWYAEPGTNAGNAAYPKNSFPSQTSMENDILDNGANPFELYNGINGWGGVPNYGFTGVVSGCSSLMGTLVNTTPTNLYVQMGVAQNFSSLGVPGGSFFDSTDTFIGEIPAYGYLPFFAKGSNETYSANVVVFDNADFLPTGIAGSFTFTGHVCEDRAPEVSNENSSNGYLWTVFQLSASAAPVPGSQVPAGLQVMIANPNLQP